MCGGDGGGGNVFLDFIVKKHMAESMAKNKSGQGPQTSKAPASGAASAAGKPTGRRQESSDPKGKDRRGDLLVGGGQKQGSLDKKTLLGG